MNRKIRSGIVALVAAIFALAIVIAPTRAMAAEIYSDSERGITVTTRDGGASPREITLTVVVEGKVEAERTVSVPLASRQINVSAGEGYDVSLRGDGVTGVSSGVDGNWNITFGVGDPHIIVGIEKDAENASYSIADDKGNEFGTFAWNNQGAVTSAYPRLLTVNVDGTNVHSQYVHTPQNLTNGNNNPQYWFTPNTLQYKVDSVELDPGDALSTTSGFEDVTVNLTTRCQCGNPLCLCEGGVACDCQEGCTCDECTGVVGENQINTGYGIISYRPQSKDGYKLNVEVYVNGERTYATDEPLYLENDRDGNLGFEPADGYTYFEDEQLSSYDFISYRNAGTWTYRTSHLAFGGVEDENRTYDNVLKIYLWTFQSPVSLNVDRINGTNDYVRGYVISFEAIDPRTNEYRTYSYEATSFDADEPQLVPAYAKVTLTARCTPGTSVDRWYTLQGHNLGVEFTGIAGSDAGTALGDEAYGNTAYLTVNNSTEDNIIVYIDKITTPSAPTPEEVIEALGGNATVDCINENTSHEGDPWTTQLTENSIKVGEIQDKTSVTVTVKPTTYVAGYNQAVAEGHELVEGQVFEYTLTHNGEKWVAADGTQVTINVDCHAKPAPKGPDSPLINELVDVIITCTNDDVNHADKTAAYNSLLEGSYLIGDPVLDQATGTYTSDVTIWSARYVQDYNSTKADGIDHDLMAKEQDPQTVTFAWDAENEKWILADGAESTTVNFDVFCETPAPDLPDTPEEISELFEDTPVVVDCVNADVQHSNGKYGILAGSYGWDRNEENPYAAALTVHPTTYVNEYNKTNPGHQLAANSPASQTINFVYDADDQKWTIAENEAKQFVFEVDCVTPVPEQPELPTEDELGELFPNGLVIVDCGTEGADHGPEPFSPIADGGYAFIELTGNVDDGATATMRVYPQAYVGAYEALRSNVPHVLVEGQTYTDVTLTYTKDAGWTATDFEPIEYIVRCTVCPVDRTPDAPTIPEVNELFVNGAVKVTCVNDKADHGSETYGLKDGYATVGAVEGNESEGWTVDVTVTPGQYVLDFQTAKGAHHTLQPTDQGAQTITLVYTTDGEWALPTAGAQFEYTVICADESTTPDDPGTTPDDPGTTPDNPGDNQDNTGDNGNQGNTGDQDNTANNGDGSQNANGNNANDKRLPKAGDATNAGLAVAVALGGVAVAGTALVVRKRQR